LKYSLDTTRSGAYSPVPIIDAVRMGVRFRVSGFGFRVSSFGA
jgi:hypothetical protein